MIDLQKLAFLPLDIDVGTVDFDLLEQYHNTHSNRPRTNMGDNTHGVYVFGVSPVMYRGTESDFYNQQHCDINFINRYETAIPGPQYVHDFDRLFPGIANAISQLPLTITHVELLSNKKDAPPHFDDWEIDGVVDPVWAILTTRSLQQKMQIPDWDIPLNSYKLFIYESNVSSFYVCRDLLSDATYGSFNKQAYVAGITKMSYPHGATHCPGLRKFVISIWGIIDRARHMQLLEQSYKINSSYAIIFNDE